MDGSLMVWALIALLLVIGAVFTALDNTGVLIYMVESLRNRFRNRKYILLFLLPLRVHVPGLVGGGCSRSSSPSSPSWCCSVTPSGGTRW